MSSKDLYTLLGDGRLIRTSDLSVFGLHRASLSVLLKNKRIEKVSRGVYIRSDVVKSPFLEYAVLSLRIPQGIIALQSALAIQQMMRPSDSLWMKLCKGKTKIPSIRDHKVSFVTRGEEFFSLGLQSHTIHGVEIRCTNLAHSVAECIVFRNRIGVDVMLNILRSYFLDSRYSKKEFEEACIAHRVHNAVQPYLQSIRYLLRE